MCEGKIRECEGKIAVNNMKDNKSPGSDGIPAEFYKTFWDLIGNFITEVYNEAYEKKALPFSQNRSILSLLYKKGEKTDIKNYRPISLTNIDYKILAHIITNRIHVVLKNIINPEQTAYVKGRYIGQNIRQIEDIINLGISKKINGIITFVDFEKAFDSIEWIFVKKTLEKFNFGQTIINWFEIIYTNPNIKIKNNGWFSDTIYPQRGLKQGCPLSAILFIISLEPLCEYIRNNKEIKGINLAKLCNSNIDCYTKSIQYADDIALTLNDENSLKQSITTLENFRKQAGLKINIKKTEIIALGTYAQKNTIQGINTIQNTRYLGINMGHNNEEAKENNWTQKIRKLANVLEMWKKEN